MRLYDIIAALAEHQGPEFIESGGWDILKFPNGVAICCRFITITTTITTDAGSVYTHRTNTQSIPDGLFIETPKMFGNCHTEGAQWVQVNAVTPTTYKIELFYPTPYTTAAAWPCSVFAIGRWK